MLHEVSRTWVLVLRGREISLLLVRGRSLGLLVHEGSRATTIRVEDDLGLPGKMGRGCVTISSSPDI